MFCLYVGLHDENNIRQLYDFFYQLEKLKVRSLPVTSSLPHFNILCTQIAPALNQTVTLTADVVVDLAPFKSLISLRVGKYYILIMLMSMFLPARGSGG